MADFCLWTSNVFPSVSRLSLQSSSWHTGPITVKPLPSSPASSLPTFHLSTLALCCLLLHFALTGPSLSPSNLVNSNQSFKSQSGRHLLPVSLTSTIWVRSLLNFPMGAIKHIVIVYLFVCPLSPHLLLGELCESQECILFTSLSLVSERVDAHEFKSMNPYPHLSQLPLPCHYSGGDTSRTTSVNGAVCKAPRDKEKGAMAASDVSMSSMAEIRLGFNFWKNSKWKEHPNLQS